MELKKFSRGYTRKIVGTDGKLTCAHSESCQITFTDPDKRHHVATHYVYLTPGDAIELRKQLDEWIKTTEAMP